MSLSVLIPLPSKDFDPTEVSVPWKILTAAGIDVLFATPQGRPATADLVMVTGKGLGLFRGSMMADVNGRNAHEALLQAPNFQKPARYEALSDISFDGLILPGGHAPGMREYLESKILQKSVGAFFETGKPVGAICHGVVLAARSSRPGTNVSVLRERKTTALPRWMELLAWNLTRLWMGSYYRTYPTTVQEEVTGVLAAPGDFVRGPIGFRRDSDSFPSAGFIVRDGNYLSARWPGDAHLFARTFLERLVPSLPVATI